MKKYEMFLFCYEAYEQSMQILCILLWLPGGGGGGSAIFYFLYGIIYLKQPKTNLSCRLCNILKFLI